jgi:hypothetical protein
MRRNDNYYTEMMGVLGTRRTQTVTVSTWEQARARLQAQCSVQHLPAGKTAAQHRLFISLAAAAPHAAQHARKPSAPKLLARRATASKRPPRAPSPVPGPADGDLRLLKVQQQGHAAGGGATLPIRQGARGPPRAREPGEPLLLASRSASRPDRTKLAPAPRKETPSRPRAAAAFCCCAAGAWPQADGGGGAALLQAWTRASQRMS